MDHEHYLQYIRSEEWRKRRERYSETHPELCAVCLDWGKREGRVELHHKNYRSLGNELDCDLQWLCREHHLQAHPRRYDKNGHELATARQVDYLVWLGLEENEAKELSKEVAGYAIAYRLKVLVDPELLCIPE
jgi:hypothetical protein